jgi:peptide/nickel transport system permease protein
MIRFLLLRVIYAAAVLLGVTGLVFGLIHLAGDPLAGLVPPGSSPQQQATMRRAYGLDRSLPEQYARFLGRAVRGDFGESWRQRRPALVAVLDRLPATLALTAAAVALATLAGGVLGVLAGARPGGLLDTLATGVALLGQAVPGFWLGTLLILVFAVQFRWLPSSGLDGPRSLVLPAIALAAYPTATITRLLRVAMAETIGQDYVRTARAKGLSPLTVLRDHALRNALLPALAYVGLQIGFLLGGAVVIEAVFAYPGVGQLALGAVADRDIPVIQAFVVVLASLILGVNLLVDLLARWLDPRLSTPLGEGG